MKCDWQNRCQRSCHERFDVGRFDRHCRPRRHSRRRSARRRLFLVEGVPGSGKTTLALQYLRAGVEAGEAVLYVTLSETEEELHSIAESHGWQLKGIEIRELAPAEGALDPDEQNTMFHPSELELAATTRPILDHIERLKPARVVFDSLSELRLLAGHAVSLSAPDSRAEAVSGDPRLHRDPAGRPHGDRTRPASAKHRARRHPARPAESRFRRRAPAPACRQVPRSEVPRRLSRLCHQPRRDRGVPAARCGRTPAAHHAREAPE